MVDVVDDQLSIYAVVSFIEVSIKINDLHYVLYGVV